MMGHSITEELETLSFISSESSERLIRRMDSEKKFKESMKSVHKKKMKPVRLGEIEYESFSAAARAHGTSIGAINYQIKKTGEYKGMKLERLPKGSV